MFKRTKKQVTAVCDDSGLKLEVGKEKKNVEMFLHFPSNPSEAVSLGLNGLPEPWPGPDLLALSPFPDCCPWCPAGPRCLLAQRASSWDKCLYSALGGETSSAKTEDVCSHQSFQC